MKFDRNTLAALVAGFALSLPGFTAAQETGGAFDNQYNDYNGVFEDEQAVGEDDWFFDSYGTEDDDAWYAESDWYNNEYYGGMYDDTEQGATDDWFFDTYDDPGEEGFFDV